jgi:hypothetical protein
MIAVGAVRLKGQRCVVDDVDILENPSRALIPKSLRHRCNINIVMAHGAARVFVETRQ